MYSRDGVYCEAPDMSAANNAFREHFAKPEWMRKNFIAIGQEFQGTPVELIDKDRRVVVTGRGRFGAEYKFKKDGSWTQNKTALLPVARVVKL